MVMNNFTRLVPNALKKFHYEIEARARKIGAGIAGLSMLSHQVSVYEQILKDLATTTKDMIITRQKDINREFVPVIERAMEGSYDWCTAERGGGCFARMKAYMNSHVAEHRHLMFQTSADEVKRQLTSLVKDVEETMGDKMDEVFIQIKRDYRSVLGGGEVPQGGQVLPRVERQVRKEIKRTILGVERLMRSVVGQDEEEDLNAGEDSSESEGEEVAAQLGKPVAAVAVKDEQVEGAVLSYTEIKEDVDSAMQDTKPEDDSSDHGQDPGDKNKEVEDEKSAPA